MFDTDAGSDSVAPHTLLRDILRGVGKLFFLVLILWVLHELMPGSDTLLAAWQRWLAGDPIITLLLFIVGGTAFVSIGLPRQTLALLGGYVYGMLSGCVLALLVTMAGSCLTYVVARKLGRPWLQRRFPAQITRIDNWTTEQVFAKTLALRLFPVGSNLATNIGAGVGHAPARPFFVASLLGFVPQTAVFALSGTAVGDSSLFHMLMAIMLLIISIVMGGYVFNAWRHRQS